MPHEWRKHPSLRGRFHPDHPDDLQVMVHDGGPRITHRKPKLVWVTITAYSGDVLMGRVLNQPAQLETVAKGEEIYFIVPKGSEHPIRVTEKYLRERPGRIIHPCAKCSLSELLEAPSDLIKATFPDLPDVAAMEAFSAFCGLCGGVRLVEHEDAVLE